MYLPDSPSFHLDQFKLGSLLAQVSGKLMPFHHCDQRDQTLQAHSLQEPSAHSAVDRTEILAVVINLSSPPEACSNEQLVQSQSQVSKLLKVPLG